MNRITRIAALAVSLVAAGGAFADDPTIEPPYQGVSTLTRADVKAQVQQVRVNGTLQTNDHRLKLAEPVQSLSSRAEVRAQTLQAIASGELHALNADESVAFDGSFRPAARTVDSQLAGVSR